MKEMLYEYLVTRSGEINIFKSIEILIVALLLAAIVFWTYKFTFSGVLYNRKFNVSLIMLTLITTMVMIVIGSDIALSLGMVGALSIVRFRTAIKDPRDTAYIFWCIGIGLSVGTQNYMVALVGSIFLAIVLIVFSFGNFGAEDRYLLIIRGERRCESEVMSYLFKQFKGAQLRGKNSTDQTMEMIYQVSLKNDQQKMLLDTFYQIEGIQSVNLVAQNGETIG